MKARRTLLIVGLVAILVVLLVATLPTQLTPAPSGGSQFTGLASLSIEATFTAYHQSPQLRINLLREGFNAVGCGHTITPISAWSWRGLMYALGLGERPTCSAGWTYTLDPTVTITNEAHDFIQKKVYGISASVAPATTDYAVVLGASSSATAIAVTDTYASAGPCDSANILNASGFVAAAATTQTAGTPSAGSVTTTLAITFTDATNPVANVQVGCMLTHVVGSGTPYIFGEVAFGPDSFAVGDQLVTTYTMTAT